VLLLAAIAAGPAAGGAGERRALSFEDRVRAQEAIERVRHAHQIGDTRPFEVAVPRSLLESKVRTFLKESAALERDWHGRVTAELLREETQRMARRTRVPDRLAELHAALGNDPLLIQECLVRPILTKRLLRSAVASSEGLSPQPASETQPEGPAERQDAERQDAERWYQEWWSEVEPRLEARAVDVVADVAGALPGPDAAAAALPTTCGAANSWQNASLDDDPEPLRAPGAVWTGTEMLVFGALDTISSSGARYDPAVDDWSPMSMTNAPSSRSSFAIAWTGSRLFVWGGFPDTNTGGLYDPTTDTWTPTSTTGAPSARHSASAVWTGGEVVVWGGLNSVKLNDGGRYDPQTDTWVAMSTVNAAAARSGHSAVWTGSVMVVWGGESAVASTYLNTGGRYDPVNDTWSATSTVNAPTQRFGHTAVWTGQRMVVWGGANGPTLQVFGGRYDPVADTWAATSSVNQPFVRRGHSAIWTGSRMIVWGGENGSPLNSGGRYDPVGDTWQTTSSTNAPAGRTWPAAVWTGSRMVVWGGNDFNTGVNTGGRYDPVGDTWAPMFLSGAPSQRRGFTTVWTGNDMIVWGGDQGGPSLATGGRYDPATDTWTPTTLTGVTLFATHHSAVWSGAEMIVWGGRFNSTPLATGGRYDPSSDTWIPVSSTGAPAARFDHSAIWDGSRLVVWGGSGASGPLGTGAAYDLFTETWTPLSTAGAPVPRANHAAVWTGSRMVIWGGFDGTRGVESGGRYDPSTDTWAPTSLTVAPQGRTGPGGVWTGSRMIIWGGYTTSPLNGSTTGLQTGGRYDPIADTWAPTTLTGAPAARQDQAAVWTGSAMMVWGGRSGSSPVLGPNLGMNDGGFYDPAGNVWTGTTATAGSPSRRYSHRAVWTGNAILVWGGSSNESFLTTGGQLCACAGPGATFYQDSDGDGRGDATVAFPACAPPAGFVSTGNDCDDHDAQVWSPPGEVTGLVAVVTAPATFAWDSQASVAGPGTLYSVRSGALTSSGMPFGATTCLASGPDTSYADPRPDPASGTGTWYLVQGRNACGLGTWGSEGRDNSIPPCP
jgi:N-acetylneuraminic acid mutarotase